MLSGLLVEPRIQIGEPIHYAPPDFDKGRATAAVTPSFQRTTKLCSCPACLAAASRPASTIPAARDLAQAIRDQRDDTPAARLQRVITVLTPAVVATTKE